MRRQPLRLRNSSSTSFRSLESSRSWSHLSFRFVFGGTTGVIPRVFHEAAGLVAFLGAVHRQRLFPALQQGAAFRRVVGLTVGQAKNHCLAVTCRDHVDLRVPSAARFADALRPVLLPRPDAVGIHLDAGAVVAEAVRVIADCLLLLKCCEQVPEHAAAAGCSIYGGASHVFWCSLSFAFAPCSISPSGTSHDSWSDNN